MSSIDDIFAGDSLRAADIEGREPTVTIKSVEPREFDGRDGKKQRKLVISFHNAKKTFVCNKTNAQRIAYLHGKDYAKWAGKQITLFVDPFVEYGGQMTPAIRVKPASTAPTTNGPLPAQRPVTTRANVTTGPAEPPPFDDPIDIDQTF